MIRSLRVCGSLRLLVARLFTTGRLHLLQTSVIHCATKLPQKRQIITKRDKPCWDKTAVSSESSFFQNWALVTVGLSVIFRDTLTRQVMFCTARESEHMLLHSQGYRSEEYHFYPLLLWLPNYLSMKWVELEPMENCISFGVWLCSAASPTHYTQTTAWIAYCFLFSKVIKCFHV